MSEYKFSLILIAGKIGRERLYLTIVHEQQWGSGVRKHNR